MNVSVLLSICLGLMLVTNIIVQVLKGLTYDKIPTNLLAVIVSFIVTTAAAYIYVSINGIVVAGWMIVALIGLAFAVAFAAMFGFDKLKELIEQWTLIKKNK